MLVDIASSEPGELAVETRTKVLNCKHTVRRSGDNKRKEQEPRSRLLLDEGKEDALLLDLMSAMVPTE